MNPKIKKQKLASSLRHKYLHWLFQQEQIPQYGILKYFHSNLDEIPLHSDIDLLVDVANLPQWERLLAEGPGVSHIKVKRRSIGLFVEIYFEDQGYLELDLLVQLRWKNYIFLSASELLDRAELNEENIRVLTIPDSFCYLLAFFSLNRCRIPSKYQSFFGQLSAEERQFVVRRFRESFQLPQVEEASIFIQEWYRTDLEKSVRSRKENQGMKPVFHAVWGFWDAIKNPEPTITFSGVDGAGKSTILEQTRQLLTEKYRREVVILRQRPSLLPILSSYKYGKAEAEKRAADTLPRQGENTSRVSSMIRFAYYLLDYLLGQIWIQLSVNRRGKLLLYDRYYFDFIVDSRRANLNLSQGFTRFFYRFIHKHAINFLLYADPKTILARKKELSAQEITDLTRDFLALFENLQGGSPSQTYLPIQNLDLEETMQTIEKTYREKSWIT